MIAPVGTQGYSLALEEPTMTRAALVLCAALTLLSGTGLWAQVVSDAEVARGVKQIEEGDPEAAIFTLDAAVRRLSGVEGRAGELPSAYLYLGIAYLATGQEATARAKFRRAVLLDRSLRLSPDRFPPRVIDLFEVARREVPPPDADTVPTPKRGSKKRLVLLGLGAAAAAGVGLAAAGGGGDSPPDTRVTRTFSGTVIATRGAEFAVIVTAAGTLDATLTWTDAAASLEMYLQKGDNGRVEVGISQNRTAPTTMHLSTPVTAGRYVVGVIGPMLPGGVTASFNLTVRHP